jgi:hypothetical protein
VNGINDDLASSRTQGNGIISDPAEFGYATMFIEETRGLLGINGRRRQQIKKQETTGFI